MRIALRGGGLEMAKKLADDRQAQRSASADAAKL
jgi:hypothetical protein